jgi:dihydropyrimidine dehydrogenase (NAD+) subunit PreA
VKLPAFSDIQAGTKASMEAGANAIALINTLNALSGIDLDTWRPIPSVAGESAFCGLSGRSVKPVALRCVALAASMHVPVSGMGGLYDWRDAAEFLLAGRRRCRSVPPSWSTDTASSTIFVGTRSVSENEGVSSPGELVGRALCHVVPTRRSPGISGRLRDVAVSIVSAAAHVS